MTKLPGFVDAIKRPFGDIKGLIIGIVLSIIPIVNFLVLGYFLQCAKTALRRNYKLPPWSNWGNLFIKGIVALVIGIIYMIPVMIVFLVTVGFALLGTMVTSSLAGATTGSTAITGLASAGIGLVITAIVAILFGLLGSAALIGYAEQDKFGAAFQFGIIAKKAFTGTFFGMWILAVIYSGIVVTILSFIPIIGTFIGYYIAGVTMYTVLAEAYARK